MSMELYYFSGTGNSLHIANALKRRFPEAELIPMAGLTHKEVIETRGERVGFVFPIQMMMLPWVVSEFFAKLDAQSAGYLFAVATHGGTPCFADAQIADILKKQDRRLQAFFLVKMPWNSPTGVMPVYIPFVTFPVPPEKVAALGDTAEKKLDVIEQAITQKMEHPDDDASRPPVAHLKHWLAPFLRPAEQPDKRPTIGFYADSTCTGCGICARACLSGKIRIIAGKPVWNAEVPCYFCYACFNFCPEQSILLKIYTRKNGRYHDPTISAEDIARQKIL